MSPSRPSRLLPLAACLLPSSAAAGRVASTSSTPTSPLKTRVGGSALHPSGRSSRRRRRSPETATGCHRYGYKITSGRRDWLNRDPIGEKGGASLYAFVRNYPAGNIDPTGLSVLDLLSNCAKEFFGDAFKEMLTVNAACAAAAARTQMNPDISLDDGFTFYPTTVQVPQYDPEAIADQIANCVLDTVKGKTIDKLMEEVTDPIKKRVLSQLLDRAASLPERPKATVRVGVRARCIGGRPKVFVFNEISLGNASAQMSLERTIVTEQFCGYSLLWAGLSPGSCCYRR